MSDRGWVGWWRLVQVAGALFLLNVSLTFDNVWPTMAIRWDRTISIELAATILILAILAPYRTPSRRVLVWLSVVWMALVAARYVEVTASALYGRDINLYWDLQFIPDVAAMIIRVAPVWLVAVCLVAFLLVIVLVQRALLWSFSQISSAASRPRERSVLAAIAVIALVFFVREQLGPMRHSPTFPRPVLQTYTNQIRLLAEARTGSRPLPPSPSFDSTFERVADADVFLVFIESYGQLAYRGDVVASLARARRTLEAAIEETGRHVGSAFVTSPTFGGSSWLAHISLISGIEVRDANTNARLMSERRDTLVKAFGRHGFETIGLMPGLRHPWPEGIFYGFDDIYGADRLAYAGPEFGWFAIPDQYSLARFDVLRPRASKPRLVVFPTISTHFPFVPTPPYQPDWRRMLTSAPYDAGVLVDAYSRQPDWTHFTPGYIEAMTYDFAVLGGYLREHATSDLVMIVVGDHQPPAAVTGETATWDVPVHVITNRATIIDRLVADGFGPGLEPAPPSLGPLHRLLPILLDAFGNRSDTVTP